MITIRELHFATLRLLGEASSPEEILSGCLRLVCRELGFDWGAFWRVDAAANVLTFVEPAYLEDPGLTALAEESRRLSLHRGQGLPGRVWDLDRPLRIARVPDDPDFIRADGARHGGIQSAFGFPIRSGREAIGMMELLSREPVDVNDDLAWTLEIIGTQIGHAIVARETEEALRASEARTKAIIEAALDCIICMDGEGRIIEFNPAAERVFGYPRDRMIGRDLAEMIIPANMHERHRKGLRRLAATGEGPILNQRLEVVALRADATEFPVELTVTRSGTSASPVFAGYLRDISERVRAEAELTARIREAALGAAVGAALTSSESLSAKLGSCAGALVENLDAAFARIWTLDDSGTTLELQASAGLYTHLDGPHSRVPVGRFKIGRIAEERAPHLTNHVVGDPRVSDQEWARREGMVAFAGYPLLTQDRLVGVMALFARHPLADSSLDALGSVADQVAVAIVETRTSEERDRLLVRESTARAAAEASEQRISDILESITDAFYAVDQVGRLRYLNRTALALFSDRSGSAPEELIGTSLLDVLPVSESSPLRSGLTRILDAREPWIGEEVDSVADRWYEIRLYPSKDGFSVYSKDITERKQVEEVLRRQSRALARSNADLEQFAYVASHDLQEPLRMIGSYTQLLDRKYRGQLDERADKYIEYIVDGAARMQRLINDLLQYSRVGGTDDAFRRLDTGAAVAAACRNLQSAISEAGALVERDALPPVVASEPLLVQLFQNLIGNAIKFRSDRPARITIRAEERDGRTAFIVEDNGIGIEPEYRDRIFAIFQRLHSKSEYPGTGIGLAICKKIVEWHGGRIWVESSPGEGSRFLFTLMKEGGSG